MSKPSLRQIVRVWGRPFVLLLMVSLLGSFASPASSAAPPTAPGQNAAALAPACDNLRTLDLNTTLEQAPAQPAAGGEWLKLTVKAGERYRLAANHAAGLKLALHDSCDASAPGAALDGSPVVFSATRSGDYYLLLQRDSAASADATGAGYQVSLSPEAPLRPSTAALAAVPVEALRRATNLLEELRGSKLTPEWQTARINATARILYRPDMQGPAYYEFPVEIVGAAVVPAGFIQVSAGSHDYPIAHWDATGLSPTQALEKMLPQGAVATTFYKLDALSYAAEYVFPIGIGIVLQAPNVVNMGHLPDRILGLGDIPARAWPLVSDSIDSTSPMTHELPSGLPSLKLAAWDSWGALKAGYQAEYAPMLASLKQRASSAWEMEAQRTLVGETLVKGDVRTIYGLPAQTIQSINVTGDGAAPQYLQQELLTNGAATTGIRLTVLNEPVDLHTLLTFQVGLQYTGGLTETVKYAIANHAALKSYHVFLPLVTRQPAAGAVQPAAVAAPAAPADDWGPWQYWWAIGDAGSIAYGQIASGTAPNTSGCVSGCGGTAWAMVFAWVDRRAAEGNPTWANHWGIYRVNGGLGSNAVAPLTQDAGVRNMTWEIRNDIGTFCIFGSGATWPWNMINAANYVRPRATAAWRMSTRYDPTGLCWFGACDGARGLGMDAIINRHQPAVVGTGWLSHYPMAFGYAQRSRQSCFLWWCSTDVSRWFYVNNGWYGSENGWTSADVWFGGSYYPN